MCHFALVGQAFDELQPRLSVHSWLWFGTAIFTHILQGYFTDTGAVMSQCQGDSREEYGYGMKYVSSEL